MTNGPDPRPGNESPREGEPDEEAEVDEEAEETMPASDPPANY